MKDIVDLTVTQLRIYPMDGLPFADIRLTSSVKAIKETFRFENVQVDPLGIQLTFSNGTFENRGKSVHILSLVFEQRRIQIQVRGSSPMADAFYSALSKLLESFGKRPKHNGLQVLLKAEDTACVATLDIDFEELVAPGLLRFVLNEGKAKLRTDYGTPKSIAFRNLSFQIKYAPTVPDLEEHDVTLSNKLLTIEPRMATPMRERRFYTSSPTDSETHLALLEKLEKEIAKVRQKYK